MILRFPFNFEPGLDPRQSSYAMACGKQEKAQLLVGAGFGCLILQLSQRQPLMSKVYIALPYGIYTCPLLPEAQTTVNEEDAGSIICIHPWLHIILHTYTSAHPACGW